LQVYEKMSIFKLHKMQLEHHIF